MKKGKEKYHLLYWIAEMQIAHKVWDLWIYCLQPSDSLLASLALSTADRRSWLCPESGNDVVLFAERRWRIVEPDCPGNPKQPRNKIIRAFPWAGLDNPGAFKSARWAA